MLNHLIVDVDPKTGSWVSICGQLVRVGGIIPPGTPKCPDCLVVHEAEATMRAALTW